MSQEFSYLRGDQAVLFIHQLPSPMVEGFFPIHQRHTIPTTYHTHTDPSGLSYMHAEHLMQLEEAPKYRIQVLAAREAFEVFCLH